MATTTVFVAPPHAGTSPAAALTTIFTPTDSYCSTGLYRFSTSSCMPPNWSAYWLSNVGYYSPAICPSGYTSACQPTTSFGPTLESTETAIVCCPSSYTCHSSYRSWCLSTRVTVSYNSTAGTSTTSTSSDSPYAIQVRWAESDLAILQTHPLSPGVTPGPSTSRGTPLGGGPSVTSSLVNPTPTVVVVNEDTGLSTGAKIGIGIGVPFAVISILAVVFFILWRRKHADLKRVSMMPPAVGQNQMPPPQQQPYYPQMQQQGQHFTPGQYPQYQQPEMMAQPMPINGYYNPASQSWSNPSTSPIIIQHEHIPKDDRYASPPPPELSNEQHQTPVRDGARELPGAP